MNAQKIIVLVAYFLSAVLAVSTANYYSSQKRITDMPFMMGMRFGRSERSSKPDTKHLVVAPRNDKFFLASRYGKRGGSGRNNADNPESGFQLCNDMECLYTGISNLFHCTRRTETEKNLLSPSIY